MPKEMVVILIIRSISVTTTAKFTETATSITSFQEQVLLILMRWVIWINTTSMASILTMQAAGTSDAAVGGCARG